MIEVRPAETDADLEGWIGVKRAVLPNATAWTVEEFRERATPERLVLVAELGGEIVGAGLADRSDVLGRGFVAPRVHPDARRRGVGAALLKPLADHVVKLGFDRVGSLVEDPGSRAFAERFGFSVHDRQVEQVRVLHTAPAPVPLPGRLEVVTIADRPELLRDAYPLADREGYADMALQGQVKIGLEDWLKDEATLPGGSFVALSDGEIVGFSGLMRHDNPATAEDGLTVVRRNWRRRGLALALKQRELAWAAANGIREVITWTQDGNEGMRRVNEKLGYEYRATCWTMTAPLPLEDLS
jgi:mycothiol synthase